MSLTGSATEHGLLLTTLLKAAPVSRLPSEDGAVFIDPWSDGGYYSISEGQVAFIRSGWIACSRGLVQINAGLVSG